MLQLLQRKFILVVGIVLAVLLVGLIILAVVTQNRTGSEDSPSVQEESLVFLEGTTINGVDVSGLTAEEATQAMVAWTEDYTFTLTLGQNVYCLTADQLSLCFDEENAAFEDLLERQSEDESWLEFNVVGLWTADGEQLVELLREDYPAVTSADAGSDGLEGADTQFLEAEAGGEEESEDEETVTGPVNAYVMFNEATEEFVIIPDVDGPNVDCEAIAEAALEAVLDLEPSLTLDESDFREKADVTADSPELLAALADANSCLDLDLTYTFTPASGATTSVTLTRAQLGRFYYVDLSNTVQVDEELLGSFVGELANNHSMSRNSAEFQTTGGGSITITVSEAGQSVDAVGLYDDMYLCLSNRTGGVRTAPYETTSDNADNAWGGNYVEVDLSRQHLWCYRNGTCVADCDIVSGCVVNGTETPTGCFTIFAKDTDRYLEGTNVDGTTYKSWVSYFMPFSGGCGIHDATWRSEFGGTIYYQDGSHGCVGVSLSDAETIYNNVSVGTHVVVYNGADGVTNEVSQGMAISADRTVLDVGQTVNLSVVGAVGLLTYSSSNTSVATVDSNGKVTAVGEGTAEISVTSSAVGNYQETTATLTITVAHTWVEETETIVTPAQTTTVTTYVCSCGEVFDTAAEAEAHVAGSVTYVCSSCGQTFGSEAEASAHIASKMEERTELDEDGEEITIWVETNPCAGASVTQNSGGHTVTQENKTVTTQDGGEQTVVVGYVCSGCGARKSA